MSVCGECAARGRLLAGVADEIEDLGLERWGLLALLGMDGRGLCEAVGRRVCVERSGHKGGVCRHDARFPARVGEVCAAPAALYVAGGVERLVAALERPVVAIVGSRKSTYYGRDFATGLAAGLAGAGVTVLTGLSEGIEAAAVHGALSAGGAPVVAMAGGAGVALPRQHDRLHRAVVERGVAVSELPAGFAGARGWCYLARNRVIAGLADVVVVVEAGVRSGTMLTAELALRLGREVGVAPGRATDESAGGSNELLRDGAQAVLGVEDVLGLVGSAGTREGGRQAAELRAPGPERR